MSICRNSPTIQNAINKTRRRFLHPWSSHLFKNNTSSLSCIMVHHHYYYHHRHQHPYYYTGGTYPQKGNNEKKKRCGCITLLHPSKPINLPSTVLFIIMWATFFFPYCRFVFSFTIQPCVLRVSLIR